MIVIVILILAPPTLGARGHLPHQPFPSYIRHYVWQDIAQQSLHH